MTRRHPASQPPWAAHRSAGATGRRGRSAACWILASVLAGCAGGPGERPAARPSPRAAQVSEVAPEAAAQAATVTGSSVPDAPAPGVAGFVKRGSGEFIGPPPGPWRVDRHGEITLNFDNAELREVVKIVMRDILGENVVIDPRVQGKVTIHTSRPLARSAVWAVLESVLQLNGAALIRDGGIPRIVPLANAAHVAPPPAVSGSTVRSGSGYGIEIVPLRFASAGEIAANLEGFTGPGTDLRVDAERNLLILAGPRASLRRLLDTIAIFDVDWLQGLSFALVPLTYVAPETVAAELRAILGAGSGGVLSGVVRLEAVERLNALLVVSKQPRYLDEITRLADELDTGTNTPGRRLHVYRVENGSAEYIAGVLAQLFDTEADPAPSARLPVALSSDTTAPEAATATGAPALLAAAYPADSAEPVSIIADKANNALLVMASSADYRAVEASIRQLDVRPRQVLIEATIAEVTLSDNLQYGVQWFLKGAAEDFALRSGLSSTTSAALSGSAAPGFFFSATDAVDDVRVLFDLLSNESELKVLSSPQVLVIDNETASIRVGDQIPVITRQTTGTADADSPIVNEVQFRDTGVLLQVTPRINEGGLVTMKISQEVSEPSADEFAAGNVSILQRTIDSSVAVRSRRSVLLGGLIRENNTQTVTGIPGLMDLPIIGALFRRTVDTVSRTELIVTITPTVITDQDEADRATADLRRRLESVQRWLQEVSR